MAAAAEQEQIGSESDNLVSKTKPILKQIAEDEVCKAEPEPKDWSHCGFTRGFSKKKKGLSKEDLISAIRVMRSGGTKEEALKAALERDVIRRKKYDYVEEKYGVFEKNEYYYIPRREMQEDSDIVELLPGIIFQYVPDMERGIIGKNVLDMDVEKYEEMVGDDEEIHMSDKVQDVMAESMPERMPKPSDDDYVVGGEYYDLTFRIKLPKIVLERKLEKIKKISTSISKNIRLVCGTSVDSSTGLLWKNVESLYDQYGYGSSEETREFRRRIIKSRNHLLWFTLLEKVANQVITSIIATNKYDTQYGKRIQKYKDNLYETLPISTYDTICGKKHVVEPSTEKIVPEAPVESGSPDRPLTYESLPDEQLPEISVEPSTEKIVPEAPVESGSPDRPLTYESLPDEQLPEISVEPSTEKIVPEAPVESGSPDRPLTYESLPVEEVMPIEDFEEVDMPGGSDLQQILTDEETISRIDSYDRIQRDFPELYARYEKAKEEYYNDIFNSKLEATFIQIEWDLYNQNQPDETIMEVVGYPTYENPDFQKIITLKQEFWDYRTKPGGNILSQIRKSDSVKSSKPRFKLQNHQRFISHFLSSTTPYNSMLIFHGVGTGKTCTSIQVAEMYLSETGGQKKAMIITPLAVQPGFRREINDPFKIEEDDPGEQCTGDQYFSMLSPAELKSGGALSIIERKLGRFIKSRYDMFGYGAFENWFNREVIEKAKIENPDDRQKQSKSIRQRIEQYFSGRLLIIDEVHNIRDPEYKKKILRYLMLIARFSNGAKIILMSATPMYNLANEIIHIINILRLNEGLPAVPERVIFEYGDSDKLLESDDESQNGATILKNVVNGLVSYLRGENPVDFPVRLPPSADVMADRNPRPQRDFRNELIDNELPEGVDIIPIIRVPIDDGTVMGRAYIDEFEGKMSGNRDITAPSAAVGLVQSAVCVFPDGTSGITGFSETFRELPADSPEGLYQPNRESRDVIESGTGRLFLHPDRIHQYAPKIAEMLKVAHTSNGISLIFTQNLQGSAIPIGMALELMGYQRVDGKPLLAFSNPRMRPEPIGTGGVAKKDLSVPGVEWQPYTYTILSGDIKLTKNREKTLRLINSEGNLRGEKVKIIIATEAISEGVNFKNLREVHMVDAYYHISLMDQVVGRAQRYRSHNNLPRNERNVSVYVWCVSWSPENPRYGSETLDETLWRKAEEKSVRIGKITRILKESAVDCHLMKSVNDRSTEEYDTVEEVYMIDSHGNRTRFNYKDQPGSRECDYQTSCAISCITNIDGEIDTETYAQSEGSAIRSEIRREIKYSMIRNPVSTHNDIVRDVKRTIPGSRRQIILQILARMIIQEEPIMIPGGRIARLEYKHDGTNDIISITPTEITDGRAPYIDRIGMVPRKPSGIYVPPSKVRRLPVEERQVSDGIDVGIGEEAAAIRSEDFSSSDEGMPDDTSTAFDKFIQKFDKAWKDSNNDTRIDLTLPGTLQQSNLRKPQTESDLGVLVGYLRRVLSDVGIPPEVWAAIIAERISPESGDESIPYMSNPEIRKDILMGIAILTKDADNTSIPIQIRHLGVVYRMNGEIIGPYARAPEIRVKTINSTGNVDVYDVVEGSRVEGMTTPVIRKRIPKGFHVYLGNVQQKPKRGEPMGMLRLFFQDYSTKLYRGYNPNNSTTSLQRSLGLLYKPGIGLVFEGPKTTKIIRNEILIKMMIPPETETESDIGVKGEKAAQMLFTMFMRQPLKIIAEAMTRVNGNYRSPIEYKTLIEPTGS
jgi:hypothetical protein